jgi:hypothetical protein
LDDGAGGRGRSGARFRRAEPQGQTDRASYDFGGKQLAWTPRRGVYEKPTILNDLKYYFPETDD